MKVYYDSDTDLDLVKVKKFVLLVMQPGPCSCTKLKR